MSGVNDGGHAFPAPPFPVQPGMTLRDWFAGQALAGMNAYTGRVEGEFHCKARAVSAYAQADAMLAARAGGGK